MACSSPAAFGWSLLPFVAVLLSACGTHEDRHERSVRQASLTNPRPVEGRLSVSDRFARWHPSPAKFRRDPGPFPDGDSKRVVRGSRPSPAGNEPEELHRIGLLFLYRGAPARAVSALEEAADRQPSAAVLSDLAAAYLALAEDRQPWLLVDAITAASRAVEQAPDEPYAAFNLALALERLSLVHEASLAWERYLALADDGEWRQEAAERLARLRAPTARERWEAEKKAAAAAAAVGDQVTLARLAQRYPRQMKDLLEGDLLTAWAEAAGTAAEGPRLAAAKSAAQTFAGSGERLYADAIDVVEKSRGEDHSALVEGQRAYAQGLAHRGDCSQAMPAFERAFDRLSAASSPLAWAARYQQVVCLYRRRPQEGEQLLADLASRLESLPYPTLRARIEGMRGLCAMAGGRHSQAVAHYEQALQLSTAGGDTDVARFYGMLDEAHRSLADRDSEWRYRMEALRSAAAAGNREILHAVLTGLARRLVGETRLAAARAVLDEMLYNAGADPDPSLAAETLLRRIPLDLAAGATDTAAADVAACARLLGQYRQPGDRERLESELMIATAEQQLAAASPAEAQKALVTAVSRLEASGHGLLLPRALLDLAQANLSNGQVQPAEEALDQALQIYEARRETTAGETLRITFFATAQATFDAMIRFQAIDRGDAQAAFAYSEKARARALRDRLEARNPTAKPAAIAGQLGRIPKDVAVIAYTVLPEALVVWTLRQGSLTMHVLPAKRTDVAAVVTALRAAMSGAGSRDAGKIAAGKAFDLLLRPALQDLPAAAELVFLPDRELYQLPFPALFDTSHGRYLIEDHPCLVAPSLDSYLASQDAQVAAPQPPRRVLAVGDPAFDTARFPTLPRLPYARNEALAVAALYKDSLRLVGEDATRQRILDALPGIDVLHLAAHVVVDARNPLSSNVATADPGRAPLRATDLDAERLAGVKLVFLAACDTAPGFADGDREGVAGLARAFLAAGVPSVVATLWAVEDQPASRLATTFHSFLLQGESPAHALRLAQLALLAEPSSSTPFAWAPFQLFRGL
jgi:CHAT domain-containing protein